MSRVTAMDDIPETRKVRRLLAEKICGNERRDVCLSALNPHVEDMGITSRTNRNFITQDTEKKQYYSRGKAGLIIDIWIL